MVQSPGTFSLLLLRTGPALPLMLSLGMLGADVWLWLLMHCWPLLELREGAGCPRRVMPEKEQYLVISVSSACN